MEYICKPKKIQLYINSSRKSISKIKEELNCDVIINGGIYNMSKFTPDCILKADGKILTNDGYKYWGYGWDTNNLNLTNDLNKYNNYICCVCLLKDHQKETMYVNAGLDGSRDRTAIGRLDDGRIWVFVQSTPVMSPQELQDKVFKLGLKDAIMLDGGGSTQGITPDGKLLSGRKVHNYICIWEDKKENTVQQSLVNNTEDAEYIKWKKYMSKFLQEQLLNLK